MHVCTCIQACMCLGKCAVYSSHVLVNRRMHTHTHTHTCMHACMHAYMSAYIPEHMHISCKQARAHTHTSICICYIYMYMYTHIHTYTHTFSTWECMYMCANNTAEDFYNCWTDMCMYSLYVHHSSVYISMCISIHTCPHRHIKQMPMCCGHLGKLKGCADFCGCVYVRIHMYGPGHTP